ncbi:membrane-bound serine protease (ClpP class) [Limimonas halophila]|uniref:Membrane-bound serine protease (ClpP class) n=1 Tax=Limimonas halophila TaxID=1082479 RepID=A0A1G7MG16_9PROT|nr:nodulation protein NfeD [Limimonas halophila]SDF60677.1 membrane-bound serine protease (ClpP class) [Limimonas halophila]
MWFRALWVVALLAGLALQAVPAAEDSASGADPPPRATVLTVDGPIGPASAGYIRDGIDEAAENGASIVVLRLNTPGGLSTSMRSIIDKILAAPIPVATYVAPRGARAASAGTYILYASHVAAMAPGTTLGAATPVQMGGGSSPMPGGGGGENPGGGNGEDPAKEDGQQGEEGEQTDETAPSDGDAKRAKAVNDAVAYIRALADLRGRNADWGEKAVREAATLTSDKAVEQNVADLLATDVADLLAKIDGRTIEVGKQDVTLATKDAQVTEKPMDWRDKLLATITDPNVAFIFMMVGVYGLIFELSNPGAIVPGVLGVICLLIGLYALNVLPVSYAGLALILVGIAFMVGEAFAPSFGALGLGGIAAFALGATMLFETDSPYFELSYWTVAGVTATTGLILVLLIGYLARAQTRPLATGRETIVGTLARVDEWSAGHGRVVISGEYWNARGPADLEAGQQVRVTAAEGLTLTVEPAPPTQQPGEAPWQPTS